jgi:hypothetical protein
VVKELIKILSGGQTGVDQAALRAALACDLAIAGWCPPGRLSESGVIPSEFPLKETPEDRSPAAPDVPRSLRTERNVRDSDATLILRPKNVADAGTDWAVRCVIGMRRPFLECDPADSEAATMIKEWLRTLSIQTLNVVGPSEQTVTGIGEQVHALLMQVFNPHKAI